MKNLKNCSIVLILFFSFLKMEAQIRKIDTSKSQIVWLGKKITGEHQGIIKFKDGAIVFKNKKVVGGNFNVDMTSLNNTDQQGSAKINLEGHLKSDEFFGVENYRTSNLVFKSISNKGKNRYDITADLTIKGVTNPVKFNFIINGDSASTALIINRKKFDLRYGDGSFFDDLGDKTIYDEFELAIALAFYPKKFNKKI